MIEVKIKYACVAEEHKTNYYIYRNYRVIMSVFCVSVCVHDNSKNDGSSQMKLEHIVVYEKSSRDRHWSLLLHQ